MSLFVRKDLQVLLAEAGAGTLRRELGPLALVTLGIGAVIGAGIFVYTGIVASQNAGPALTLSMVLAGIACAFAGICYAELASMIPVSGSAYTYAYATMGELIAWIIGWDLILEYSLSSSSVAVGWSGYAVILWRAGHNRPASPDRRTRYFCSPARWQLGHRVVQPACCSRMSCHRRSTRGRDS